MKISKKIRRLYDLGSQMDIVMERAIVSLYRKLKKKKKKKNKK